MSKYISSYGEANRDKKYFYAITRSEDKQGYSLYIVNASDEVIKVRKEGMGSFITQDDVVLSSGYESPNKNFAELLPQSFIEVAYFDDYDLDWITEYSYTLIINGVDVPTSITIGKSIGFMGNYIPILNKYGRRIYDK